MRLKQDVARYVVLRILTFLDRSQYRFYSCSLDFL